jgi:hypothetical protein
LIFQIKVFFTWFCRAQLRQWQTILAPPDCLPIFPLSLILRELAEYHNGLFEIAVFGVQIVFQSKRREILTSGLLIPSVLATLTARVESSIYNAEVYVRRARVGPELPENIPPADRQWVKLSSSTWRTRKSTENICKPKDLYGNFRKAIAEVSKVTDLDFVRVVSRGMFKMLKLRNDKISEPQQAPSATIGVLKSLNYLHTRNFCEYSLGLLKVAHLQLSKTITNHQI